jgi:hypothetical protein
MILRDPAQPSWAARLAPRAAFLTLGLAVAATLSGCPDGGELENPEQNMQYVGGTAGVGGSTGGSAGVGGTTGGAGAAQAGAAGAPAGGAGAGTAGGAGTGSGTWVWDTAACGDVKEALKKNCARAGCHGSVDKYAGLDLTDPALPMFRAQLLDQVAMHGDIGCNATGTPFRQCTPEELVSMKGCPSAPVKLLDSANPDASWVLTKINGTHGTCGDAMPISPGNTPTNGWDAAGVRKKCYIDFFRSLAAPQ